MIQILHLEDNPLDARLIREKLLDEGLEADVKVVATKQDFVQAIENQTFDLILADFYLPGFDGIAALQIVKKKKITTPVILISGKLGEEAAVKSLQEGAVDYILKDYLQRLSPAVKRALEEHEQLNRTYAIEQELIKNAQLFRTAENIGKLGTFEWNIGDNSLFWSDGIYEIFQYDKATVLPSLELYVDCIHQEDRPEAWANIERVIRAGGTLDTEYRILTTAGKTKHLKTIASCTSNPENGAMTLTGVCQDITESKLALDNLEKSEEKYRTLVEQATDGILICDQHLHILEVNTSALEILETTTGIDLLGKRVDIFLSPNELLLNPINARLIMEEGPVTNVREVHTFQGNHRYLEITSKRIPGGLIQTVFRDVTDREMARKELEQLNYHLDDRVKRATKESLLNEAKYRLISENSTDLITQSNAEGFLTYVSPSVRDMIGLEPDQCLGKTFCSFLTGEEVARIVGLLGEINAGNRDAFTAQHQMKHATAAPVWVETVCRGIRNEAGEISTVQTATRDIHSRKEAEEEMKKAMAKERELSELRSHFVSMASHQFRTPLTVINSNVQLMELIGIQDMDARVSQILRRISNETSRLTDLMNDVLILGKLNARRLQLNLEKVEIEHMVMELIEEHFHPQEDQRKVSVEFLNPVGQVEIDPGLTEHVLINLITNAFKYSPNGSNPELSIWSTHDKLHFELKDRGIGVPKEDRDNLFQSFYRGRNTSQIPGTGLGLVIAKEFVELQNGEIGYYAPDDGGSVFWVELPIHHHPMTAEEGIE